MTICLLFIALENTADIRLTQGDFGTIEVFHDGQWGTVCDDAFDLNDFGCVVVCKQLGFR